MLYDFHKRAARLVFELLSAVTDSKRLIESHKKQIRLYKDLIEFYDQPELRQYCADQSRFYCDLLKKCEDALAQKQHLLSLIDYCAICYNMREIRVTKNQDESELRPCPKCGVGNAKA